MEQIVEEVAKTAAKAATAAAETTAKTAAPVAENLAGVAKPAVGAVAKINNIPPLNTPLAEDITGLESTVKNLQAKEASVPTSTESAQAAENLAKQKEVLGEVLGLPRFKEILGEIQAQKTDVKITPEEMQQKAFAQFSQELADKVAQDAQGQKDKTLTTEQQTGNEKQIKEAFAEDPKNMRGFTKDGGALAEAKATEKQLQEDQNATPEQKTQAAESRVKAEKQYNARLDKMVEAIIASNPKAYQERDANGKIKEDPRNHPLVVLLTMAPNNPEVLEIMKKERNKSLLKRILEIAFMVLWPLIDEIKKTMTADFSAVQQGQG